MYNQYKHVKIVNGRLEVDWKHYANSPKVWKDIAALHAINRLTPCICVYCEKARSLNGTRTD